MYNTSTNHANGDTCGGVPTSWHNDIYSPTTQYLSGTLKSSPGSADALAALNFFMDNCFNTNSACTSSPCPTRGKSCPATSTCTSGGGTFAPAANQAAQRGGCSVSGSSGGLTWDYSTSLAEFPFYEDPVRSGACQTGSGAIDILGSVKASMTITPTYNGPPPAYTANCDSLCAVWETSPAYQAGNYAVTPFPSSSGMAYLGAASPNAGDAGGRSGCSGGNTSINQKMNTAFQRGLVPCCCDGGGITNGNQGYHYAVFGIPACPSP